MQILLNGTNITGQYRPAELAGLTIDLLAHDGELGMGTIPQPDSSGAEWQAGDHILVKDGPSHTITILDGFLNGQVTDRPEAFITRRVHKFTAHDGNAWLYGFRASNWKRPAETDRARVLAMAGAFFPGLDTTWVLNTNTASMPAKTYDTDTLFAEVLNDVRSFTGKTMYVENGRFHSHLLGEGQTADFSIGGADPPYTSVFPLKEGTVQRTRDALQLVDDVMMRNSKGQRVTRTDSGSIALHDAGGLKHQAIVDVPTGVTASMAAQGDAYLAINAKERYTYEGDVNGILSATDAARFIPGSLASCSQSVWNVSSTVLRLARVTLTYLHPVGWRVHVYYANPIRFHFERSGVGVPAPDVSACRTPIGTGFVPITSGDGHYPPQLCGGYDNTMGSRLFCHDEGYGNPCGLGNALFWGPIIQIREQKSNGYTVPDGAVLAHITAHVTTDPGDFGTAGAHGWQIQFVQHVPVGNYDGITIIGPTFTADTAVTADIPANLFDVTQPIYFIAAPSWVEQDRTVCGSEGDPFPGGDYLTTGAVDSVTWLGWCPGTTGRANWVGGAGQVDGTNSKFALIGWDWTGVPQAKVNGLPTPVTDNGNGTVSFTQAPPAGSIVTFDYQVGPATGASPTPPPIVAPGPPASAGSLQALVDAAAAGATILVPFASYTPQTVELYKANVTFDMQLSVLDATGMPYGIRATAPGCTIKNGTVENAANPRQTGAIRADAPNTLIDSMRATANAGVGILIGADNCTVQNSEMDHNGQEGWAAYDLSGGRIQNPHWLNNHVHDNHTDLSIPTGWEAGGGKACRTSGLLWDGGEVDHNAGPGIWLDIDNDGFEIKNQKVHHNQRGVMVEISSSGSVHNNSFWENGWTDPVQIYGWPMALLISSSSAVAMYANVFGWNAGSIGIVSQARGSGLYDWDVIHGVNPHDNVVVGTDIASAAGWGLRLLGWFQDHSGTLFSDASNHSSGNNQFYATAAEPTSGRYWWNNTPYSTLAAFAATQGGTGSTAIASLAAAQALLTAAGIPTTPEHS